MSASVPPPNAGATAGPPSGTALGTASGSAPDPSMEDILASIRRILSEDEPAAKPADKAPPATNGDGDDDVLSLDDSMLVAEPVAELLPATTPEDRTTALLAAMSAANSAAPAPIELPDEVPISLPAPPIPGPVAAVAPYLAPDRLIAPEAEAATASSVNSLLRTLEAGRAMPVYRGGPTLEDMVREELRALLKEWLDTNLPPMVERLVRAEIDRVVGRAVG